MTPSGNKFIALTSHCALKHLEELYLYDIENDELYELGQDAYQFLTQFNEKFLKQYQERKAAEAN